MALRPEQSEPHLHMPQTPSQQWCSRDWCSSCLCRDTNKRMCVQASAVQIHMATHHMNTSSTQRCTCQRRVILCNEPQPIFLGKAWLLPSTHPTWRRTLAAHPAMRSRPIAGEPSHFPCLRSLEHVRQSAIRSTRPASPCIAGKLPMLRKHHGSQHAQGDAPHACAVTHSVVSNSATLCASWYVRSAGHVSEMTHNRHTTTQFGRPAHIATLRTQCNELKANDSAERLFSFPALHQDVLHMCSEDRGTTNTTL